MAEFGFYGRWNQDVLGEIRGWFLASIEQLNRVLGRGGAGFRRGGGRPLGKTGDGLIDNSAKCRDWDQVHSKSGCCDRARFCSKVSWRDRAGRPRIEEQE